MKRLVILFALGVSVFVSCTKNSKESDLPDQLRVNKTKLNFTAASGVDSFEIQATSSWTIQNVPAWLKLSQDRGAGNGKIRVECEKNTAFESRTGTIAIYSPNVELPVSIEVTQEQTFVIVLDDYYTAAGGEELTIYGQGFSTGAGGNVVKINGVEVEVLSYSATEIKALIPVGLGSGLIEVTANNNVAVSESYFIYKWMGTMTTWAGGDQGHIDGALSDARFRGPAGLHFDVHGNLFVAEYGNNYIRKISTDGIVSTLPGRITHYTDPTGPLTSFDLPNDVTTDLAGNVYVAETNASLITKIATDGTVSIFAGGDSYGTADGVGSEAQFYQPTGIVSDGDGNLYVADFANNRIRKITPEQVVTTLAGRAANYSDGTGNGATFHGPQGIRFHSSGDLIVTDYFNHRIRKVTPGGTTTTLAGNGGIGATDGHGVDAEIGAPMVVATDAEGRTFIAGGTKLRMIESNGVVSTIQIPQLAEILGIAVDGNGAIYLSDYTNHQIYKVTYE